MPAGNGVERRDLRVLRDAEPFWVDAGRRRPCRRATATGSSSPRSPCTTRSPPTGSWSTGARRGRRWLNGSGDHHRDVTDQHDFRLTVTIPGPTGRWTPSSTRSSPTASRSSGAKAAAGLGGAGRVGRPGHPPRAATRRSQFFGGDLDGITAHLDHIAGARRDTVYLTPIFPARSNHRYDAGRFDQVDPLLGGDEALARLAAAVHAPRHAADRRPDLQPLRRRPRWFQAARRPGRPERGYYYLNEDGTYVSWLGHASLPKFNMASAPAARAAVRHRRLGGRALAAPPYELDGWRIDVANMTGRSGADDNTRGGPGSARPSPRPPGRCCSPSTATTPRAT